MNIKEQVESTFDIQQLAKDVYIDNSSDEASHHNNQLHYVKSTESITPVRKQSNKK